MKKILLIILLIVSGLSFAQNPAFNWVKTIGGPNYESGNSLVVDKFGYIYSAGTFSGTVDFDSGVGVNLLVSKGDLDIFVTKHDSLGNLISVHQFGSSYLDNVPVLATDQDGNIYLSGHTFGNDMDFDPGPATYTLSYSTVFLVKLDVTGNFKYAKAFGGSPLYPSLPTILDVVVDGFNNIYLTGSFKDRVDFNPGAGLDTVTSVKDATGSWTYDVFVLKMDSLANFKWVRQIGSKNDDWGYSVDVDKFGNVAAGGLIQTIATAFSSTGNITIGTTTEDGFVAKYNANGDLKFADAFGAGQQDRVSTVAFDKYGNLFIGGYFRATVDFDPGLGTTNLTSSLNSFDGFVLKIDTIGAFLWIKQVEGDSKDEVNEIYIDSLGRIFLMGFFTGYTDFDPSTGSYFLSSDIYGDEYICQWDSLGTFLWAKQIRNVTNGGVSPSSIAIDKTGNVYSVGGFYADADFDTDVSLNYIVTSAGNQDIYIHKLGHCLTTVAAPVSTTDPNQCSGKPIQMSVTGNGSILWYSSATSTLVIGSGPTYSVPALSPGAYTYYVEAKICSTSPRIPVSFTVVSSPTVTAVPNSSIVCKGVPLQIIASGADTYTWQPGGQMNDTVFVTQQSATVYTLTGTSLNGCAGTSTLQIAVYATTPTTIVNTPTVMCSGNTTTLSITGALSYTWSNGAVSNTTAVSPSVTASYSVNIENTYGCVQTRTLSVNVNPKPNIIVSGTNTLCAGATKTLSATGANTYTWSSGQTSTTIVINPLTTSSYSVTGTNTLTGCANTVVKTITVNPIPSIIITVAQDTVCKGATATMTASGASTYTWTIGTVGANFAIPVTVPTSYTVIGTSIDGCMNQQSVTINIYPTTTVVATASPSVICSGEGTTLLASGATTYTWSGLPLGNPITIFPSNSSVFGVNARDGHNCSCSQTVAVNVNQSPSFNFSGLPICYGQSRTLQVSSTATSYTWNPGGVNSNSIVVSPTTSTIYTLTGSNALCTSVGTIALTVNPLPTGTLSVSGLLTCGIPTVGIGVTSANPVWYNWTGNGIVTTTNTPNVIVNQPNTFSCILTNSITGCVGTLTTTISSDTVSPSLTVTVSSASVCLGSSANISANGADTYTWSNGATATSINVIPLVSNVYTVTGKDITNGCVSTQTVILTVDNTCADVWPGDANSDGVADNLDVLELGLHYTQTGAPRASVSNNWQSYFANNWTGTITNSSNLNHSDCNGDGVINDDDTLAIYNNYGLTHTFKTAQTNTVNPQLSIVPDQSMVVKGNWGTASVYLGDATANINNINGVAFTVDFDNTLIEPNSIWLEYQNSFIDASQNVYFRKLDFANSKLYTASTHTVSNNVSGFGKIATLHYQIKSSLATDEVLNIGISQANQSSATGSITPLSTGAGTLMAIGASVGVKESLMSGGMLVISPNPTNGLLNISFSTVPKNTKIELYNSIGALVLTEQMSNKTNAINMSELSSGIYFMKVLEGNKVVAVKKVVRE